MNHPNTSAPDVSPDPSDAELVAAAQRQDTVAYNELIARHHHKIYGLIYGMTSNREDAEDLTQEVFYKGYTALSRFKGDAAFYTWIYRIAVNRTINFLSRRKRRTSLSLDDVDGGIERDPSYVELSSKDSPFRDATLSEIQEKLNMALQKLSEKHRTVVVMHDVQGVPHEEIAQTLGVSCGTVRSRLFYARKLLQKELAEWAP